MKMPEQPWLLVVAAVLLASGGALIGTEGRIVAASFLLSLGAICLGAWIGRGDE